MSRVWIPYAHVRPSFVLLHAYPRRHALAGSTYRAQAFGSPSAQVGEAVEVVACGAGARAAIVREQPQLRGLVA